MIQNSGNQVKFRVHSNGGQNPVNMQYEKTWNAPTYTNSYDCNAPNDLIKIPQEYISGDFNGDGLTDVIAVGRPYTSSSCVKIVPQPGRPCGIQEPQERNDTIYPLQSTIDTLQGQPTQTENVVQFPDCCDCETRTNNYSQVNFINLDRRLATGFAKQVGTLYSYLKSTDKLLTADVNGDGRTDVLHVTDGKIYAYTMNSSNNFALMWTTPDTRIKKEYSPMLGDYNGDGKTDLMYPTAKNSGLFALFLSTGKGFIKTELTYPFQYKEGTASSTVYTYNLIPIDVNGDGRTDILDYRTTTYNSSTGGTQSVIAYSNAVPAGTGAIPAFSLLASSTRTGNLKHFPVPIFLSADKPNNNLVFGSISDKYVTTFKFNKDNREEVLLRSTTNNGVTQSVTYRDLDPDSQGLDYISVYEKGAFETYPYIDIAIAPGTKVAVGLQRSGTGITTLKQGFSYYGAVTHMEGLGFMGFKGVARSNWYTEPGDRFFNVSMHSPQLRGAVISDYMARGGFNFISVPTDYIHKTAYVYSSSLGANKVFNIKNTSSTANNSLNNTTMTTAYVHDTYNNPTKVTTNYNSQGSTVVDITYGNSTGTTYFIGRPVTKKETGTIAGNVFNTEEQYVYSGYLLSQKKTKGNGTEFNTETYSYDAFGNIIKKVTTPYGMPGRQVSFIFDTSGRFLTKATDVEGLATNYVYNTGTGTLASDTNPFGLITKYFYDGWNRPVKVTDYLSKNLVTSYVEGTSNQYTVTSTGDDGSGSINVYDKLKRLTLTKQKDVLGQWVSKSYVYDKFDRVTSESEPYMGTSPSQWNTTEYDIYGRTIRGTAFTGKMSTITYNGLTATVNDGTKTVSTTKNAMDNVTRVQDPGGTINYTYFGDGAMKTTVYDGTTVTIAQDGWGRKTSMTDPSAGNYSYTYNGFGEMLTEKTPKGTTTYTYAAATGKLSQKKVVGDNTNMSISYTYDAISKLMKSTAMTSSDGNNTSYAYTYDSSKRLTKTVEGNPYATFTKNVLYDSFGRVDTEESIALYKANNKSSTKKIKNTYQNGGLLKIADFTTNGILWTLQGINARGQVTQSTVGNNLKKTNIYTSYGFLTEIKTEKSGTAPLQIMKLSFNFEPKRGNLLSRTNSLFGWTENFTYDNQDRLLAYNDNNGNKSQSYDLKGRIANNPAVGTFAYSGSSYRQSAATLNTAGTNFYNTRQSQQISYNAFKSPVEINQNGKDRASFQ